MIVISNPDTYLKDDPDFYFFDYLLSIKHRFPWNVINGINLYIPNIRKVGDQYNKAPGN